jgi:AcrR family transcriptional regulator
MPRTREENQRIREEQRKHILQAAIKVFAHKGIATTKMADIALEANVSYGLVYHYFLNKEQVLDALLEHALEEYPRRLQLVLERPGTSLNRLYWFTSEMMQILQANPEFVMVLHHVLVDEELHNKWREAVRRSDLGVKESIRELIVEGQHLGEISGDDPDLLVTTLLACIRGLTLMAIFHGCAQQMPDASIVLRLLKA